MRQIVTTILDVVSVFLILAGAVSIVVGVVSFSVPLAFIVAGVEAVGVAFGGLWASKRVAS